MHIVLTHGVLGVLKNGGSMNPQTLKQMGGNHHPLQPLNVTFAPGIEGLRTLSVLSSYEHQGWVSFESKMLVLTILRSQDWSGTGQKLTMHFHQGPLWNEARFLRHAEDGIKGINVALDSPLNSLQSSRQKKREEALANIAQGVLTNELRQEFSDWGLTFKHCALKMHGLHSMRIMVKDGKKTAFTIHLDGWSGNILSEVCTIIAFCSSYKTAQAELRNELSRYLSHSEQSSIRIGLMTINTDPRDRENLSSTQNP